MRRGDREDGEELILYIQYIERKTEKDLYFGDYKSALQPCNHLKNRYSNVLPCMLVVHHTSGWKTNDALFS